MSAIQRRMPILLLLWLSLAPMAVYGQECDSVARSTPETRDQESQNPLTYETLVPRWLGKRVTIEEAEEDNAVTHEELGPDPVPFGFQHERWLELKAAMVEGDELCEFCSPPATWELPYMCGRQGIALMRDGEVVAWIVTLMC